MFGYVKPFEPDLRLREYETYRALYCGLCRSMGKHTGLLSRLTLNYDFVFLTAVRIALSNEKICPKAKRCMAHPFQRRSCCKDNSSLEYAAAASALLCYYKVLDNVADSKGFKRFLYRLGVPFAKSLKKKSVKKTSLPVDGIESALKRLNELETAKSSSIDDTADCFGNLLAEVFSHGLEGNDKIIADSIGKSIGRYIYVVDAVDDMESDIKSGNYNPVVLSGIKREEFAISVKLELKKLASAIELIDYTYNREIGEIIRNIVYEGLVKISEDVFEGKSKKGKKL